MIDPRDDDLPFVTDGRPVATGPAIPQPEFIPIADMDAWAAFWAANSEALESEVGDESTCLALVMNCNLVIGGGASPAFRVGFVD